MWTWLRVRLGLDLRWRLERGDLKWTILLHDSDDREMVEETLSQVGRMLAEGWTLTEQPDRRGVDKFCLKG